MRAAVFREAKRVVLAEVPTPDPGVGQVRVKLEGSGVCASNLPCWEGRPWFSYPMAPGSPGHEGWGVVDAIGDGVYGVNEGDRVALLSHHAYAEYDVAEASQVTVLPPSFPGGPFPGEALACAMNIFRRADIGRGQRVAIVGIGFLGALLTRLAATAGASVIAVSRRAFSRELAWSFGASETVALTDHASTVERVMEWTHGRGCERVIEAVGLQAPLDVASAVVAERGRLVIAGYHQDEPRRVDMQSWNWRGLNVVNAHERAPEVYMHGMREAVAAVLSGRIDPSPLYTHHFSLGELGDALAAISERPSGLLKAWVCP